MSPRTLLLVVEDDQAIAENLSEFLSDEGYSVHVSENGREALDYLDSVEAPPALILLDLTMPVLDGWGFRAEQGRSRHAGIPVIVLTASGQGPPEGVAGVLRKPLCLDALLDLIRLHS